MPTPSMSAKRPWFGRQRQQAIRSSVLIRPSIADPAANSITIPDYWAKPRANTLPYPAADYRRRLSFNRRRIDRRWKKHNSGACCVCATWFQGGAVSDIIAEAIQRDHPDWSANSSICRADLTQYRTNYVHNLLQSERGELTELEQEVLHSMRITNC